MLEIDPNLRASIPEIAADEWFRWESTRSKTIRKLLLQLDRGECLDEETSRYHRILSKWKCKRANFLQYPEHTRIENSSPHCIRPSESLPRERRTFSFGLLPQYLTLVWRYDDALASQFLQRDVYRSCTLTLDDICIFQKTFPSSNYFKFSNELSHMHC